MATSSSGSPQRGSSPIPAMASLADNSSPSYPTPKRHKGRWIAGGLLLVVGAVVAVAVTAPWDSGSSSSDVPGQANAAPAADADADAAAAPPVPVKDEATAAATVIPKTCGALEMYSKAKDNSLDGTFGSLAYGPLKEECCVDYECETAFVLTYLCDDDTMVYEMNCCVGQDCESGASYSETVTRAGVVTTLAAKETKGLNCAPTGDTFQATCGARPKSKTADSLVLSEDMFVVATPEPTTPEPTTPEPTTPEPTTAAPTPAPTADFVLPEDQICTQDRSIEPLPGVKPGSCLQVMCIPEGVNVGDKFNAVVRWCMQRPRSYHVNFDLLDRLGTKNWFNGLGETIDPWGEGYSAEEFPMNWAQCGERTFNIEFDAELTSAGTGIIDVMWKFFVAPMWGPNQSEEWSDNDPFPNMLAETGIKAQPVYNQGLINDCEYKPTRYWNLPPTGKQDAIDFPWIPLNCVKPGQAFGVEISTHLESIKRADLHVNLMIGTGFDKYLGPNDIYLGESNVYGLKANKVADYWVDGYWTKHNIVFDEATTNNILYSPAVLAWQEDNPGKELQVYVTAFLTPMGDSFYELDGEGNFVEDEYGNLVPKQVMLANGEPRLDPSILDADGNPSPIFGWDIRERENFFNVALPDTTGATCE